MLIKFFDHDTGSGRAAVVYLQAEKDSKGEVRADVQVLRGNPEQIAALIDSLSFVNRYRSGVIAFHVDDDPSDEEIHAALDDFERVAFAGLEPNQYTWCAVLHEESDGSKHVHIVIPRVELTTGKSLNIAPPGWEKTFYSWRNALNYEHGWARPDDPRLARLVQPGAVGNMPAWKAGTDPRQQITEWLTAQVAADKVNTRADVLQALASLGQINRQGRDYISVRLEEGAKPIRLKGALYDEKFDGRALREVAAAAQKRPGGREQPEPELAEAARSELKKAVERRAEYNQSRYQRPRPSAESSAHIDDSASALADALASAGHGPAVPADAVGLDALERVDSQPGRGQSTAEAGANQEDRSDVLREPSGPARLQKGVNHDGVRKLADEAIERAKRAARAAAEAASRAADAASRAAAAVVAACRKVDRAMPVMSTNQVDELERFKREINFVEVAESMGYQLVKINSTKACKVMKSGSDTIVIATDASDGHGIYFSTGDDADNGTVIDFLLRRTRSNLGQIRKELRGWMPGAVRPSPKRKPVAERPEQPQPVERDRAKLLARFAGLTPYIGRYLTSTRKVDRAVIDAFRVLQDGHGNACFPHRDPTGVSGWESKNKGFTGFSEGGNKSLFLARLDDAPVTRIVVAEAAIDLLSWSQFKHAQGTVYVSTGGSFSPEQMEQLRAAFARNPGAEIVLAQDGDSGGDRMAAQVRELAPPGATVTRDRPPQGLDWNDVLRSAAELAEQREKGPDMHR
jgi:hypothetical protein